MAGFRRLEFIWRNLTVVNNLMPMPNTFSNLRSRTLQNISIVVLRYMGHLWH